jgi:hypothetical protein
MPWYVWLPIFAIALHQLQNRHDEVIQLIFLLLTSAALGGLLFSSSWILHLGLIIVLLVLPICEFRFQHIPPDPCDRPCLRKSLCRAQNFLQ